MGQLPNNTRSKRFLIFSLYLLPLTFISNFRFNNEGNTGSQTELQDMLFDINRRYSPSQIIKKDTNGINNYVRE